MEIKQEKDVWVVYENTDNTEGRGRQYPSLICEIEETARRLSVNRGVQGSNAYYYKMRAYLINNVWVAPVDFIAPTKADLQAKEVNDKVKAVLEKAKALGLEESDLEVLRKGG